MPDPLAADRAVQPRRPMTLSPLRSYAPTEVLERDAATGRALTVRLPTGHRAWYQRREDDCMRAAVATAVNAPIEELPDPRLDERLAAGAEPDELDREAQAELESWLAGRGWRLVKHTSPPVECGAWIAVSPGSGPFGNHVVVMCEDRVVHDPASNWPTPAGMRVAPVEHIVTGYTIEPMDPSDASRLAAPSYPGRVRIAATDNQGVDQHGLLWGFRSRHYNAGTTAQLFYEAEALTPLNGAAGTALAGASGGSAVVHSALPANSWVSLLSTNMIAGTVPLTHTGSYRVWARCYSASATPQFQFVWGVGSLSVPKTNDPVQLPGAGAFYLLDLGEARLDAPPVGANQWFGAIQTQVPVANQPAAVDGLYLQPLDDGAGKLTYNPRAPVSSVAPLATAGTGIDDSATGTQPWSNPNNITAQDGVISAAGGFPSTTHYLKAESFGFTVPSSAAILGFEVRIARFADQVNTVKDAAVRLVKAGVVQATDRSQTAYWPLTEAVATYGSPTDLWGGTWAPSDVNSSTFGAAVSAVISGAAKSKVDCLTITVYYTLAPGFIIAPDAVIAASKTTELRTEGMVRQAGGSIYGPVSSVIGDLPRIPPSGLEARPVEVFLKASRGNFADEPDSGIDDLSARIIFRPSYLYTAP